MSGIWKNKQLEVWPHFGRRIVENAGIFRGASVLDIGSGRGNSLLPAAELIGPDGLVVGIDNWEPCVVGVRKEISQHGYRNAYMMDMDAQHPGFESDSFDFVLSGFSYIFCPMAAIFALLKPGGKVSLSSWKHQEDLEWMGVMVNQILDESEYEDLSDMGDPSPDGRPWVYFRDSEDKLKSLLANAGFKDIGITVETASFRYRDAEEWWDQMHNVGWQGYLEKIRSMGEDTMVKFKDDCLRAVGRHMDARGLRYTRTVMLATGKK